MKYLKFQNILDFFRECDSADVELSNLFATKESDNPGTHSIQESTKIDDTNTISMSPSTQFNNDTDFANFQLGESVIDDSIQCLHFNTIRYNSGQAFFSFRNQRPPQTFLWYSFYSYHVACGMLNSLSE